MANLCVWLRACAQYRQENDNVKVPSVHLLAQTTHPAWRGVLKLQQRVFLRRRDLAYEVPVDQIPKLQR